MEKPIETNWPKSLKRTPVRLRVAELLDETSVPLCVSEIYERLRQTDAHLNLSTVYRVLDAFVAAGLAEKTIISSDAPAYYAALRSTHCHYAVCLRCRRLIPLAHCPFDRRNLHLVEQGFEMTGHRLEIYGYCAACRAEIEAEQKEKTTFGTTAIEWKK